MILKCSVFLLVHFHVYIGVSGVEFTQFCCFKSGYGNFVVPSLFWFIYLFNLQSYICLLLIKCPWSIRAPKSSDIVLAKSIWKGSHVISFKDPATPFKQKTYRSRMNVTFIVVSHSLYQYCVWYYLVNIFSILSCLKLKGICRAGLNIQETVFLPGINNLHKN